VFEADSRTDYFDLVLLRLPQHALSEFVGRPVLKTEHLAPGFEFSMNGLVLIILARPLVTQIPSIVLGRNVDWLALLVPFWGSRYEESFRDVVRLRDPGAIPTDFDPANQL
jgi:hypothetical protein